jgi:hypothetical protein
MSSMPMDTQRWMNRSQPQTLYNAVLLSYISAFFDILYGILGLGLLRVIFGAALVASGYAIANEKKWGWMLGIGLAAAELLSTALALAGVRAGLLGFLAIDLRGLGMLTVLFTVARLVLLLHDQSKDYVRIWFR